MSTPTDSHTETSEQRPSIGGLLGDVSKDLSELLQQEIALAKAEATQSATRVGKGAGLLGGAGMAGHFMLLFLSIALWWGLGNSIGRAVSGLVVAAMWALVCAALALVGRSQLKAVRGLDRTTESVKKIPTALKGHEQENS